MPKQISEDQKAAIRKEYGSTGNLAGTARAFGMSKNTVRNIVTAAVGEADGAEQVSPAGEAPVGEAAVKEDGAEQGPPVVEPPGDVGAAYDNIGSYAGGTGTDEATEVDRAVEVIKKHDRSVRRARQVLGRAAGAAQPPGVDGAGVGATGTEILASYHTALKAAETEAMALLERLGYKVLPKDSPATVEEATEILKNAGFKVQDGKISLEEVETRIAQAEEEWEQAHDIEVETRLEESKIKAGEHIVDNAVDKIFKIFVDPLQKAIGMAEEGGEVPPQSRALPGQPSDKPASSARTEVKPRRPRATAITPTVSVAGGGEDEGGGKGGED